MTEPNDVERIPTRAIIAGGSTFDKWVHERDFDRLRDERDRLAEALREIVRQVQEYPALSPTGIMVRDDIAAEVARRFPNGGTHDE